MVISTKFIAMLMYLHPTTSFYFTNVNTDPCLTRIITKYMNNKCTAIIYENSSIDIDVHSPVVATLKYDKMHNVTNNDYDYVLMAENLEWVGEIIKNPYIRYLIITKKWQNVEKMKRIKPERYVYYNIVIAFYDVKTRNISIYTWMPFKTTNKCGKSIKVGSMGKCGTVDEDPFMYKMEENLQKCPLEICINYINRPFRNMYVKILNTFGNKVGIKEM